MCPYGCGVVASVRLRVSPNSHQLIDDRSSTLSCCYQPYRSCFGPKRLWKIVYTLCVAKSSIRSVRIQYTLAPFALSYYFQFLFFISAQTIGNTSFWPLLWIAFWPIYYVCRINSSTNLGRLVVLLFLFRASCVLLKGIWHSCLEHSFLLLLYRWY